jgi:hypothetical protein
MKRVLISSAWLNPQRSYDLAIWKKRKNPFAVNAPMTEHFGLRFLKANHPEITILEYPTQERFLSELVKSWDVVGISFYINETNDAIAMAKTARDHGAYEVWAGNYGAMTRAIAHEFDKTFLGWGELPLASELGKEPGPLVHPATYMHVWLHGIRVQSWGVLFTSRGCNKPCTFCQTPRFYHTPYTLDMSTIEPVIAEYRRRNVSQVIVLDENFGYFEDYTDQVIDLLQHYRLSWNPLTRVDTLYKNYQRWKTHGLCGASVGLESLNQDSIDGARKGNDLAQTRELLKWMNRDSMLVQAFYIIGFEQDTEQLIRDNIYELRKYHIDSPQIQILTPQPETNLYKYIENTYGIYTYDYSKYDTTYLVWNHPHITPQRMRELQFWANDVLFTPRNSIRTAAKVMRQALRAFVRSGWHNFSVPIWTGNIDTLSVQLHELMTYGSRSKAASESKDVNRR